MKNRELYQKTFSQIHSSTELRWEDFQDMRKTNRAGKRLAVLAAVIGLLALLSAAAVATDFFGLRRVLLPQKTTVGTVDAEGVLIPGETEQVDVISLSGFQNAPESRALAEWQAFLDGYDPDGSIIAAVGNNPTGFEERYGLYLVYTQEMADKLEEIAEKYGLKLHRIMETVLPEQWEEAVGSFLREGNTACSGYIYEDGTFAYDGEADIPGYGTADYQFRRSVNGTLHDVILNVTDASQYEDWVYETACGQVVTLALSESKALILADMGDSFIVVNVLAGTETPVDDVFSSGPLSRRDLKVLADLFDFTALTPAAPPNLTGFAPPEADQEMPEDPIYVCTGIESGVAAAYADELARLLADGDRESVAEMFHYPCRAVVSLGTFDAETPEELLLYYDEAVGSDVRTLVEELRSAEIFASDGMVSAGEGSAWFGLVEDGEIRLFSLRNSTAGTGFFMADSGISAG